MSRKRKKPISVHITTEHLGLPLPFSAFPFPNFDDDDDESENVPIGEKSGIPLPEPADPLPPPCSREETTEGENDEPDGEEKPEHIEFFAEGKLVIADDRVEIVYEESVATGMAGSVTIIGFDRAEPSVVTMYRQGLVDTSFVFEAGKRHISIYSTPFSALEICVHALTVRNELLESGIIELDYLTELRGARAERCKMKICVD